MKYPLKTYIFVFFVLYFAMLLSISLTLLLFNVYAYFIYAKGNIDFFSLFDDVYFKLVIYMPIVSALGLTGLYFSRR